MSNQALEALLAYQQADEGGVMVLVSRQAIHEVAARLAEAERERDEAKAQAFMDTAVALKRRIELMLALPLDTLASMSLQRELERIGKVTG